MFLYEQAALIDLQRALTASAITYWKNQCQIYQVFGLYIWITDLFPKVMKAN